MRLLFVQPVVSHVRYQRRLEMLEEQGATVEIVSFDRDYYAGRDINRGYVTLGYLEHGQYFKRIPLLCRAFKTVRRHLRGCHVVYTFGLDMAILALVARIGIRPRPRLVYEVGDIVEVFLRPGLAARAWRKLEGLLLDRSDLLVSTSEAFIREYFEPVHGNRLPATLVIENKPKLAGPIKAENELRSSTSATGCLRIGWFGLLRCSESMEILSDLVRESEGRFELVLRGIGMAGLNLDEWAESSKRIFFGGPYVAPEELPEMYASVDLVWSCFPLFGPDGREMRSAALARTNRFYEACFFHRPLISRNDSEDGRAVIENGIGLCVDLRNREATVGRLLSITKEELTDWQSAMERLPPDIYSYTDEHERLLQELR